MPLGLGGLYLRLRVEETPAFRAVQRAGTLTLAAAVGVLLTRETAFQPLDAEERHGGFTRSG